MRFPHVFSPVRIGAVELKNRIFVPAHTTNYGVEHLPSERHVHYHAEKARGGVGLIIFEAIRVHPSSIGRAQGVIGYDPRGVPAFRRVAEAVHAHDAKLFGQIVHVGRHAEGYFGRTATWGASPIPWAPGGPIPHEMNEGDGAACSSSEADRRGWRQRGWRRCADTPSRSGNAKRRSGAR
jgi:2,4-dienoyl-CoA reductase-like NADH-dependent reductase (Old Yellow Enzyme family)